MRNKLLLLIFLLFLLTSCSQKADAEYLIGGNWIATAGYEDGEIKGVPNCHFFEEGLEFKDEDTVYNADFDIDFNYRLSDKNKVTEIDFAHPNSGIFTYSIHVISENEIGLVLVNPNVDKSCYLERK